MKELQETITTAISHHQAGRLDKAAQICLEVLRDNAQQPELRQLLDQIVQFHIQRATSFVKMGQYRQAIDSFQQVAAIQPQSPVVHASLGKIYLLLRDTEHATRHLRQYLELDPSDANGARALLAQIGAKDIPDKPDSSYHIREFYDQYAANYDEHLLGDLNYQCPKLIARALREHGRTDLCVLDLGCGTGLCGQEIKPLARRLDGVDLSKEMLQKANEKRIYDLLREVDIYEFLATKKDAYDAVVAGGLFEHIGDPIPIFSAVRSALKLGGMFIFTAEDNGGEQLDVNSSGFFTHCSPLLQSAANDSGLSVVAMDRVVMWKEGHGEVGGLLASLSSV